MCFAIVCYSCFHRFIQYSCVLFYGACVRVRRKGIALGEVSISGNFSCISTNSLLVTLLHLGLWRFGFVIL